MYASYYSYRDPNVVDYAGPAITLFVFSVYGLVWGAVISTSLHFITKHTTQHISRRRLTDDSGGPINWRSLDVGQDTDL